MLILVSPPPPHHHHHHTHYNSCQGVALNGCRRNLKKEKRARNEACARQYRKAPKSRFRGRGGGPSGAARDKQENADNEWLAQVFRTVCVCSMSVILLCTLGAVPGGSRRRMGDWLVPMCWLGSMATVFQAHLPSSKRSRCCLTRVRCCDCVPVAVADLRTAHYLPP